MTRRAKKRMFKVFVYVLLIVTTFLSISAISNGDLNSYSEYKEVYVRPGDTIWSIAKEHYGNDIDVREGIYMIKECTGIESSSLTVGQVLLVPVID